MIESAAPSDLADVKDCAVAAYGGYVALIGRRPAPMEADYAKLIAAGHVHVARDGLRRLQGYVVFYPEGEHLQLDILAVWPHLQGRGIGRALVDYCEAAARRMGIAKVCLYTNAKMQANLALYPHLGYVEVERRVENGFDRVYFEKRLM